MKGAFQRGRFNISARAIAGENTLAVKIYPLEYPGTPKESCCGGDRKIGNTPATIYQSVNWDCTIIDGVRDRAIGIYRDVTITATGPVSIRDPFVFTEGVPTADEAHLGFKTSLFNNTSIPQSGTLELESEDLSATRHIALAPGESKEVSWSSAGAPDLTIAHPRLWWPVGNLRGERPELIVEGWNLATLHLPLPGQGETPRPDPALQ